MSLMRLSFYPDPVLLKKSEPVTQFDDALRQLVDSMFETMYAEHGAGLAAPQVGVDKRLFVMDCRERGSSPPIVIANPLIIHTSGKQNGYEGCLSVPGYSYKVERPKVVVVRGHDLAGRVIEYEGVDFDARCIMHETDHCDGQLYISRLTTLKRQQITRSIHKRMKRGEWPYGKVDWIPSLDFSTRS
jgi:peptide deformylase